MPDCSAEQARMSALAPWQRKRTEDAFLSALNQPAVLADIAQGCNLSIRHFTRRFSATYGTTPHKWLMQKRVDYAKRLLDDTGLELHEIAGQCGFADVSHMARVFRRMLEDSPAAFRRKQSLIRRYSARNR